MREAILYKELGDKTVQCRVCNHYCVIPSQKRGKCGVRENQKGKLVSLVYGEAIACNVDPVEKKPLFHFMPGTYSLSVATVGCNFACQNCQNYDISQGPKQNKMISGQDLSPEKIVELALKYKTPSISYTYTEPTIFIEYALETMKLAKKQGLKNSWVTNGYLTPQALEVIAPYLDAANVDLKFFQNDLYQEICGAKLEPILNTLKLMKKLKIWLEITTLLIPDYTNAGSQVKEIAQFIFKQLGPETPWHISRFYPCYKMTDVSPTPLDFIHQAVEIGKKTGLKYVYAGNLPGDKGENTYCPQCQNLVIERVGYEIKRLDHRGKCPKCGEKIDLIL